MSGHRSAARCVAPLAAATLLLGALAACTSNGGSSVDVAKVSRSTVTEVVEAPATVAARAAATVTSPATGTVARVYVTDGAHVDSGQLLVRISSPSAQQALSAAIAADAQVGSAAAPAAPVDVSSTVKQSDAAAKQAFAQAQRAVDALPAGAQKDAAQAQLKAAKAQYAAARAAVTQAVGQLNAGVGSASAAVASLTRAQRVQTQAAVAAARRTVDALDVRAPVAGVVSLGSDGSSSSSSSTSDLSSLLGQLPAAQQGAASSLLGGGSSTAAVSGDLVRGTPVSSGQELLTVTDLSRLSLSAQVDETDVLLVKVGVRALAELAAVPGAEYAARVTAVGLKPTTSSRGGVTYVVRLALGAGRLAGGGAAPAPRPGMSAVVRLQVLTARDAVSVPAAAVVQDGGRSSVWLVTDGVAHRRAVRLGAQGEAAYQVLSGVEVGDTVVVRGADQVREGQRVG